MHQRYANARATSIHARKLVVAPPIWGSTIIPYGTHHGTSAAIASIHIESVMIPSAISIKPIWDRERSVDTVRVGLSTAYSVYRHSSYIYRWDGDSLLPQLQWACSLSLWRNLCMQQWHANARATSIHAHKLIVPPMWSHGGVQHNIAARYAPWHIGCSHFNSHQISSDTVGNLYKANMTKQF